MKLCLVPIKAIVKKSSCKITEVSVKWFQLSEVSVRKATEVELQTWVEGTAGGEGGETAVPFGFV